MKKFGDIFKYDEDQPRDEHGRWVGYHVTPASNLESIKSKGLEPRIGERSSAIGEKAPAVHLFTSHTDLEDALTNWLGDQFSEDTKLALLKVKGTERLRRDPAVGYEAVASQNIKDVEVLSEDVLGESDLKRFFK